MSPPRMIGQVEFLGGAVGALLRIELRDGKFHFVVDVRQPHPAFDARCWRLFGPDQTLIVMTSEADWTPCPVEALDTGGTTTAFLPFSINGPGERGVGAVGPGLRGNA